MNEVEIKIRLSREQMDRLADILAETAATLEDDGREGNPDAKLIWSVQKLARKAAQ